MLIKSAILALSRVKISMNLWVLVVIIGVVIWYGHYEQDRTIKLYNQMYQHAKQSEGKALVANAFDGVSE